jgi:hypothetical protein
VIGPRALDLGAVAELEVDVAGGVVGDRVVAVLIPDVGEAVALAPVLALLHRLGTAVGIDHEDAVVLHVRVAVAEVVEQLPRALKGGRRRS